MAKAGAEVVPAGFRTLWMQNGGHHSDAHRQFNLKMRVSEGVDHSEQPGQATGCGLVWT
jgi:hypothetical protein